MAAGAVALDERRPLDEALAAVVGTGPVDLSQMMLMQVRQAMDG